MRPLLPLPLCLLVSCFVVGLPAQSPQLSASLVADNLWSETYARPTAVRVTPKLDGSSAWASFGDAPGAQSVLTATRCPPNTSPFRKVCTHLQDRGGRVMSRIHVKPVFWGTKWQNPRYVADKMTGIMQFYQALAGSDYLNISKMYMRGSNISLTVDPIPFEYNADAVGQFTVANRYATTVGDVVCGQLGPNYVDPDLVNYFPVYVDFTATAGGYCGWHTSMRCANNGQVIRFALLFDQTGQGCDVGAIPHLPSTGQSNSLMGMTVVSGHELVETMTDPDGYTWIVTPKSSEQWVTEIADLCSWRLAEVTLSDGQLWVMQSLWDNAVGCTYSPVTTTAAGSTCRDGSTCPSSKTCCCGGSSGACSCGLDPSCANEGCPQGTTRCGSACISSSYSCCSSRGYCKAGMACCGNACMPASDTCCVSSNSTQAKYCRADKGHCCSSGGKSFCGAC